MKTKLTPEITAALCAQIAKGANERQACKAVGLGKTAFYDYINKDADFADAIKQARKEAQQWEAEEMITAAKKSLRVLIEGMEYEEKKTVYISNPNNPDAPRIKEMTVTKKRVMPNAAAVFFALTNRDPENWKNRTSSEVTADVKSDGKSRLSLGKLSDELLEQILKQLAD